jgi:hypothetical protein
MSIVVLGVDLGKNSCSVVGVDAVGTVITRRSMRRQTLIDYGPPHASDAQPNFADQWLGARPIRLNERMRVWAKGLGRDSSERFQ